MGCEISREFSNFGIGITKEHALSSLLCGISSNGYEIKQIRLEDDDKDKLLYEDREIFINGYGLYRIIYKERLYSRNKNPFYDAQLKFIGPEIAIPNVNTTFVDIC